MRKLCTLLAFLSALAAASPALAAPAQFAVQGVLALDAPLMPGDYAWDDSGVAGGPTSVVVDLSAQLLYVYKDGIEVGRTFIMYGSDEKPTPTGLFTILEKDRDHVSNLYNAPMPYMLRLTRDGISIHGSEVDPQFATHGCVGVPDDFAALLFAAARVGDQVLITRNWQPEIYATAQAPNPAPEPEPAG